MFGIVGGSGAVVNMVVVFLVSKFFLYTGGPAYDDALLNIAGTRFNIRGYHLFQTIAFLVANIWNYQLNRTWTFGKLEKRSWLRGFFPFLATGIVAFLVQISVATALINHTSVFALPEILDDTSGLRSRLYWGTALSILIAMPVNFIINKLWAFRAKKPTQIVAQSEPV
ncbi:GtrA family protein [Corynebacterium epidermidicanis]|uniref:Putative membrane protein n=1 Tax=Corynebacterium epidermidicanis TaxID=1050174 RepID=A0A0G3GNK4_9CORY|nr:GtrA family protein [Corynebacterium epidermidicanis]AKK02811.1 putative membrane protein [Corynebacterium epidermidicanis]